MILWEFMATAAFALAFGALVMRWLAQSGVPLPRPFSEPLPVREEAEKTDGKKLCQVFILALIFRVATALGSLFLYRGLSGAEVGLSGLTELWCRWDAPHYIRLTELGYGGYLEGGEPLFLVFFPLYVWLTRAVTLVIHNTALAGMAVSFLSFAWGNIYLYGLVTEEYGERMSRRTLLLLWTFPFSFFFGGIMTESLFFLTTAAALYHIRGHRWGRAAVWGILAALTRMQGVLLIGAACAEIFCAERPFAKGGEERARALGKIGKRLPVLMAPVLGSLVYLALNQYVAGDPFAFAKMQEHWSQGFMWFPRVLAYLAKNAFTWHHVTTRWEMWIPELTLFPVFALLLWRSWKRHRSMFTLYAVVYFILNYSLSWLLSAGRYLSCAVPCFFFAADLLEEKPRMTVAVAVGMLLLQCVFCYRYFCWGQVM